MTTKVETEAKIGLTFLEFQSLAKKLGESHFYNQRNDFYSHPRGVVRVRYENGRIILNKKTTTNPNSQFKSMHEKEIEVYSENDLQKILSFFDFQKFFSYEKQRADYRLNSCVVSLDHIPSYRRYFIEIEGEEKNIFQIIRRLGLQKKPNEKRSYLEILNGGKNV